MTSLEKNYEVLCRHKRKNKVDDDQLQWLASFYIWYGLFYFVLHFLCFVF